MFRWIKTDFQVENMRQNPIPGQNMMAFYQILQVFMIFRFSNTSIN